MNANINKEFSNLINIIQITEAVASCIHGVHEKDEIFRIIEKEFKKNDNYQMVILMLDEKKLDFTIASMSTPSVKIKMVEKVIGNKLNKFIIPYKKVKSLHSAIEKEETYTFPTIQLIKEVIPSALTAIVAKITGHDNKTTTVTPIKVQNKVVGLFAIDTPELAEYFIPSIKNLGKHISQALDFALENEERKKAEASLRESEEQMRVSAKKWQNTFNSITDIVCVISTNHEFLEINETGCKSLGLPREEIIGRKCYELAHGTKSPISGCPCRNALTSKKAEYSEITQYGRNYLASAWPIFDENKNITAFSHSIKDITERKQSEKELLESKQITENILSAIPVRVFWKDRNLKYLGCNEAFAKDAGFFDPKDMVGKDDYQMVWHEHAHLYRNDDLSVIESGIPKLNIEEQQTTPDGKTNTLLTSKIPLKNEKGEIYGVLGSYTDITERKNIEEALQESEDRYRNVVNVSPDAIIIHQDGVIVFANQSAVNLIGAANNDELIGKPAIDFVHPDDRLIAVNRIIEMNKTGIPASIIEERMLKKDGTTIYVEVAAVLTPYKGAQASLVVIHDITKRKKTEIEIIESKLFLQNVLNTSPSAIFTVDKNKCFTGWNKMAEKITGYTEEEVLGKPCTHISACGDYCSLFDDEEYIQGRFKECNLKAKNGDTIFSLKNYEQLKNAQAEVIGGIESFLDLTELKATQKALYDSEEKFKQISQSAHDGIILIDNDGKIGFWNKAAETIFNYSEDEVLGKDLHTLLTPDKYLDEARKGFRFFRETGTGNAIGLTLELEGKRKNGEIFPIELSLSSLQLKGKWNAVGIVRDISDRKKWEKQLIAAKEKAEQSDKVKSAFLSTMSHELRTPLNAVIGFSSMIDENLPMEEVIEFNKIINQSGNHLLHIIEDIFDISLIESGIKTLDKTEFELKEVTDYLQNIIKNEQSKMGKEHIKLFFKPQSKFKNIYLLSDKDKIQQIMNNLLINALKYTKNGSIEFGYQIENEKDFKFYVKDTGIGIPENMKEVIFENFRRVEETNTTEYGGVGLGLSITKKLVEIMNDRIEVESIFGKGSTFSVYFPEIVDKKEEIIQPIDHSIENYDFSGKSILIVEDEVTNYLLVFHILKKTGSNVIWAQNGREAIDKVIEDESIGLVLMDLLIPIIDGFEATKEIKKIKPNLPVFALSAHAGAADAEKAMNSGCEQFISKPLSGSNLLIKIKGVLG